jgi:starch phosphorylase
LLFRDPERLARILNNRERPVQIIMAGKAHPLDNAAKEIVRQIVHFCRREEFRSRIVFIEDYDMVVARHLVQGADVWLNTPRRPEEASGTSGMKAALNGVLNMSVLDGWWPEAYRPGLGWRIGHGEEYEDPDYQDEVESHAIYDLLEKEVAPLFYDRGPDGIPRGWTSFIKASIRNIAPRFNTNRMVHQYFQQFYLPAALRAERLAADDLARAKELAAWLHKIRQEWSQIRIGRVWTGIGEDVKVGSRVPVQASIYLGNLRPSEVTVELYHGALDPHFDIYTGQAIPMSYKADEGKGSHTFIGEIPCHTTSQYGFTLRVVPRHEDLSHPFAARLIKWADDGLTTEFAPDLAKALQASAS